MVYFADVPMCHSFLKVIDRRIRELNVKSIMLPLKAPISDILKHNPKYADQYLYIMYLYIDCHAPSFLIGESLLMEVVIV